MKKTILAATLAALVLPTAPAMADNQRSRNAQRYYTTDNGIRYWQGEDGRYYCKRSNGTTGLLIGGAAGALVGRAIDSRGDRTTGTVVGAAGGALVGREIQRTRRCR
ncbi:MAG: glycine zipper 2TM domain-containing protein [Novosphingobium sp.]